MIGINTFLTWVDIFRAAHARRPYHLVTYLHQLTIPSSGLVSPQVSSLHRLAWLALRADGTQAACALKMHFQLMIPYSRSGLEWAWTWLPRSERTTLSYSTVRVVEAPGKDYRRGGAFLISRKVDAPPQDLKGRAPSTENKNNPFSDHYIAVACAAGKVPENF